MFSKKATKFDEIFTFDLTLCSKYQIDGEDFVNFCGLLWKNELSIQFFPGLEQKSSVLCKKNIVGGIAAPWFSAVGPILLGRWLEQKTAQKAHEPCNFFVIFVIYFKF